MNSSRRSRSPSSTAFRFVVVVFGEAVVDAFARDDPSVAAARVAAVGPHAYGMDSTCPRTRSGSGGLSAPHLLLCRHRSRTWCGAVPPPSRGSPRGAVRRPLSCAGLRAGPLRRTPCADRCAGLVVFPFVILVGLTWSVFWMDRESLGSRMDISFIGVLTVVAFQIVVSDRLPRISCFTIMSSFMYVNYLTLAAGVFVNLRVSSGQTW
jgi:hypothetical protein